MGKKNFDDVRTTRSVASVFDDSFNDAPEQTPETPKEQKSQKDRDKENNVTRVNLALTNDNYSFVRMMAMTKGKTVTGYLNSVVEDMRKRMQTENPELFKLSQMLFPESKQDDAAE